MRFQREILLTLIYISQVQSQMWFKPRTKLFYIPDNSFLNYLYDYENEPPLAPDSPNKVAKLEDALIENVRYLSCKYDSFQTIKFKISHECDCIFVLSPGYATISGDNLDECLLIPLEFCDETDGNFTTLGTMNNFVIDIASNLMANCYKMDGPQDISEAPILPGFDSRKYPTVEKTKELIIWFRIKKEGAISDQNLKRLWQAISKFEDNFNFITFINEEDVTPPSDVTPLTFVLSEIYKRCSAHVGYHQTGSFIYLAPFCFGFETVSHEILHTFGFAHIHLFKGADKHFKVNRKNIAGEMTNQLFEHNYEVKGKNGYEHADPNKIWDFDSIMNYSSCGSSKCRICTKNTPNCWVMSRLINATEVFMPRILEISVLDKANLFNLYGFFESPKTRFQDKAPSTYLTENRKRSIQGEIIDLYYSKFGSPANTKVPPTSRNTVAPTTVNLPTKTEDYTVTTTMATTTTEIQNSTVVVTTTTVVIPTQKTVGKQVDFEPVLLKINLLGKKLNEVAFQILNLKRIKSIPVSIRALNMGQKEVTDQVKGINVTILRKFASLEKSLNAIQGTLNELKTELSKLNDSIDNKFSSFSRGISERLEKVIKNLKFLVQASGQSNQQKQIRFSNLFKLPYPKLCLRQSRSNKSCEGRPLLGQLCPRECGNFVCNDIPKTNLRSRATEIPKCETLTRVECVADNTTPIKNFNLYLCRETCHKLIKQGFSENKICE